MLRGLDPALTRRKHRRDSGAVARAQDSVRCWRACVAAPNMGAEYAAKFNPIYPRSWQKNTTRRSIPSSSKASPAMNGMQLPDGLHPTREGVEAIVAGILPAMTRLARPDGPQEAAAGLRNYRRTTVPRLFSAFEIPPGHRDATGLFSRRPARRALDRTGGLSRHPALFRRHRRAYGAGARRRSRRERSSRARRPPAAGTRRDRRFRRRSSLAP